MDKQLMKEIAIGYGNHVFNGGNMPLRTFDLLKRVDFEDLNDVVYISKLTALAVCMYARIAVTNQLYFRMVEKGEEYKYIPLDEHTMHVMDALYAYVNDKAVPSDFAPDELQGKYSEIGRSLQRRVEDAEWRVTVFMDKEYADKFADFLADMTT